MSPGAGLALLQGCREEKETFSWVFGMYPSAPWLWQGLGTVVDALLLLLSCSPSCQGVRLGELCFLPFSGPAGEAERAHPRSEERGHSPSTADVLQPLGGLRDSQFWVCGVAEAGLQSPLIAVCAVLHSGAANLPPSVCSSFLIAFLTSLLLFCWQCPEARSPPGALALACQN